MRTESALLRSLGGGTPVLEAVSARGRIDGLVFDLTVEQRYANPTSGPIEAIYTFPLPWGAVLLSMELEIGERRLSGVVVEKKAAQSRYEDAIDKGDTAVLLERASDGLYTVNVANLLPGEKAVIRYRYVQMLSFAKGQVRVNVPTVIAPRYGKAVMEGGLEHQQVPSHSLLVEYPFTIEVDVHGQLAKGLVHSSSHAIGLRMIEGGLRASLAGKAFLDRDFVLTLNDLSATACATIAHDGEGYVLHAAFCPKFPGTESRRSHALKILVDCSGSMQGDSITAARKALHEILSHLGPEDRFALTRFGSTVDHIQKGLRLASDNAIRKASEAIAGMQADLGGTEMEAALASVLGVDAESRADILLITDGHSWNADGVIRRAQSLGQRIFAVGIGAAPAEALLRRLSEETGGASELVTGNDDIAAAITRMFHRMGQPPATSVEFEVEGGTTWISPAPQVIYKGETTHLFAGIPDEMAAHVTLSFTLADGTRGTQTVVPEWGAHGSVIDRIAAFKRLPLIAEPHKTDFAIRHGLVTERTSLVLVHERADGEKAEGMPSISAVPQMVPAGFAGVAAMSRRVVMPNRSQAEVGEMLCDLLSLDSDDGLADAARKRDADRVRQYVDPNAMLDRIARQLATKGAATRSNLPQRLSHLAGIGVPPRVLDALATLEKSGFAEKRIVFSLLELVSELDVRDQVLGALLDLIGTLFRDQSEYREIRDRVRETLAGTTADTWVVEGQPLNP